VREHHPFWLAGRPRRVDDRRQILRADRGGQLVEEAGALGVERAAAFFELRQRQDCGAAVLLDRLAFEDDDVAQRGAAAHRLADALVGRAVLHEEEDGAGVVDDVARLRRRERRVDGHVHGAGELAAHVRNHPLGRTLRDDRHAVAAGDAERVQPQRDGADAARELRRRDGAPRAPALVVERVGARVLAHGALEDLDERARLVGRERGAAGARGVRGRGVGGGGRRRARVRHLASTPSKKISRTSSAIGASL
jgi:hypothetical protein